MKIIDNLFYTEDHEWLKVDGNDAYVGVTDFAQSQLGDIVYIEVETVGETIEKGESFGTIEAVKTVSDMFMPVKGEILEFNPSIEATPEVVNKDPYGEGWIVKIKMTDPSQVNDLLKADKYKELVDNH
jgi:glycine cleavage system H protein